MSKQGIIALLIFLGSVTLVCAFGLRIYRTTALPLAASGQCYALEMAIEMFHETLGEYPPDTTNEAIVKELQPSDERPMDFLFLAYKQYDIYVTLDRPNPDAPWTAIDVWKRPVRVTIPPGGPAKVVSAGPDGAFDTADDITSERARSLEAEPIRKEPGSAEPQTDSA